MSFESIVEAIEVRFNTYWKPVDADVVYGNNGFNPDNDPWIRLSVSTGESIQITVGSTIYRTRGIIFAQIFYPLNRGDRLGQSLADKVGNIFRAQKFNNVNCMAPSSNRIGVTDGWSQINVLCPFYTDENLPTKSGTELLA